MIETLSGLAGNFQHLTENFPNITEDFPSLALQVFEIAWLDLLLSGDNAVVIAMACRNLPENKRRLGIALGAGAAVGLRILFTLAIFSLLAIPYVKLVGGILLLGVAVKLTTESSEHGEVKAPASIWGAVATIAVADGVMSLDNVLAIVGVAHGQFWLVVFGLLLSIPLVVFGAGAVLKLLDRWPILLWAGAALLGWVAGEMIADDPFVIARVPQSGFPLETVLGAAGAFVVVAIGGAIKLFKRARKSPSSDNNHKV